MFLIESNEFRNDNGRTEGTEDRGVETGNSVVSRSARRTDVSCPSRHLPNPTAGCSPPAMKTPSRSSFFSFRSTARRPDDRSSRLSTGDIDFRRFIDRLLLETEMPPR
ncbi:hypothetical protein GWI33_006444 [Rhynchophorus ferrugineus]|uniref:Uncharacterized protein n=1 Tax=Rhynchophorus ferrugineus TaxID=354439 RepID=A0A834MD12_RHYFE|nr:hypothetical protein GWI33_006444 [Rhynchophorus ferrugineus]